MSTSALVRLSPLNTPVMHPTQVRIHHFFVPNRIVWDQWEDFITGGPNGDNLSVIPNQPMGASTKNVAAYQGVAPVEGHVYNTLGVRGYNMIYNEYYRDQDLVPESQLDSNAIKQIAWEKDCFSGARPWTQKGPDVVIPFGERADVSMDSPGTPTVKIGGQEYDLDSSGGVLQSGSTGPSVPVEMYADLESATGVSVNDFRASFALQRYQEARARYGSRFTEYLRYLGITPSDSRLDRPEYLSGGTQRVQYSEVLQTAEDAQGQERDGFSVGDMYGHGIAGARSNRFRKFFEEHGYVHTLLSIRPKAIYVNATQREFLKKTKEDFFQKELVHLGQQEIYDNQLYPNIVDQNVVFGYEDRYDEYRRHLSQVSGDFRDTLNAYHMGRDLDANTVLNQAFTDCEPSDRIFQVGTENADTCWIMANNHIVARRLVPKRAYPKIL